VDHYYWFNLAGNVLIIWATAVGVASVIVHARVPWRRTPMGRHLMYYMSIIAAVLVLSCVRIFLGDSPQFQLARLVVFVGVPLAMTQRLMMQIRAGRAARAVSPWRSEDGADA
jgi:hypothetical protein